MIWIDASLWLEIGLNQERAEDCLQFLTQHREERLCTSDFDVYTIILTMLRHKKTQAEIMLYLGTLSSFPRLTIFRPAPAILVAALEAMEQQKLTFDDALAYSCMKQLQLTKIATLDQDFKKVEVEMVL